MPKKALHLELQWRDRSGLSPDSCRTIAFTCELLHYSPHRVNA
ncbi:hypothetical protein RHOER0001_0659 [Rhodococcus erythropolis SK121]|nr:hypothetical protein RHOER0001_0659 [Rhodococcus erythropolis SK121]